MTALDIPLGRTLPRFAPCHSGLPLARACRELVGGSITRSGVQHVTMQSRGTRLWAIFAGYTALGLFIAAANSLTYLSSGSAPNWIPSIKRSLGEWYGWAALTPLILMLAERRPIQRGALVAQWRDPPRCSDCDRGPESLHGWLDPARDVRARLLSAGQRRALQLSDLLDDPCGGARTPLLPHVTRTRVARVPARSATGRDATDAAEHAAAATFPVQYAECDLRAGP